MTEPAVKDRVMRGLSGFLSGILTGMLIAALSQD
jgi:hypothetical protein